MPFENWHRTKENVFRPYFRGFEGRKAISKDCFVLCRRHEPDALNAVGELIRTKQAGIAILLSHCCLNAFLDFLGDAKKWLYFQLFQNFRIRKNDCSERPKIWIKLWQTISTGFTLSIRMSKNYWYRKLRNSDCVIRSLNNSYFRKMRSAPLGQDGGCCFSNCIRIRKLRLLCSASLITTTGVVSSFCMPLF